MSRQSSPLMVAVCPDDDPMEGGPPEVVDMRFQRPGARSSQFVSVALLLTTGAWLTGCSDTKDEEDLSAGTTSVSSDEDGEDGEDGEEGAIGVDERRGVGERRAGRREARRRENDDDDDDDEF